MKTNNIQTPKRAATPSVSPGWVDTLPERCCKPRKPEEVRGNLPEWHNHLVAWLVKKQDNRQYDREILFYLRLWVSKNN